MKDSFFKILLTVALLLPAGAGGRLAAQDGRTDVLRLNVYFRRGISEIDPTFRDNGANMNEFRRVVEARLAEGCSVDAVLLRGSASPEGASYDNRTLAENRSHALDAWFADTLGLRAALYHREAVGEDWEGLARIIRTLDVPWRDEAVSVIVNSPEWVVEGGKVVDSRKNRLRRVDGGRAWRWLDENVFPELRAVGMSVECIISHPVKPRTDTVYISRTVRDTVYIDITPQPQEWKPSGPDYSDRRMLFALRTNVLAVPFANAGIEIPLGRRWSVGADIYYPWIWRPGHAKGVDDNGVCNELMAADLELRYWFPRKDMQAGQRLLGHSIGLYGAAGHYDFERNWSGLQGEFYNVGLDYLYAVPIFQGRMHLEFELGLGYIWSEARPYDCMEPGGVLYHRKGVTQHFSWIGPTRAQFSLVVPIYTRKKGGVR